MKLISREQSVGLIELLVSISLLSVVVLDSSTLQLPVIGTIDHNNIEFKPNKTVDEMVFITYDSNTSASPRQVIISAIGAITTQLGRK